MDINQLRDNEKRIFNDFNTEISKELSNDYPTIVSELNSEMGKSVLYIIFRIIWHLINY